MLWTKVKLTTELKETPPIENPNFQEVYQYVQAQL